MSRTTDTPPTTNSESARAGGDAIAQMPFEAALAELEDIVRKLEQGSVPLEDSIRIYERGEALKKHCEGLLKSAEARIEKINLGPDGSARGAAPLDVDA